MTNDEISEKVSRALKAMDAKDDVRQCLVKLMAFCPEGGWTYPEHLKDYFEEGDDLMSLASETCTYNLMGKEDGRTLLYLFRQLAETLGFDSRELEDEAYRTMTIRHASTIRRRAKKDKK